jgi:CheY-like chemotaxis protein
MPLVALVVDDSMLIRHTVCRFLEERGFSVESAANGREALEVLERMSPDLIITDMQMPKMDGGQLIDALKSHPKTATIPVIVLSGKQSGFETAEKRADFSICKDIDIAEQLAKALQLTLGVPMAEGSTAGK